MSAMPTLSRAAVDFRVELFLGEGLEPLLGAKRVQGRYWQGGERSEALRSDADSRRNDRLCGAGGVGRGEGNAIAIVIIVFLVFGLHIYGQERQAIFRERELQVEFDNALRIREAELISGGLGVAVGVATAWAVGSYKIHLRIQRRLTFAKAMLEKRFHAFEHLDDDDTTEEALDLTIRFSQFLSDPETPHDLSNVLRLEPNIFRRTLRRNSEPSNRWGGSELRPDLMEALNMANIAGMRALVARWPQLRPAFDEVLVDLGASPVEEAEKVIAATNETKLSDRVPSAALARSA